MSADTQGKLGSITILGDQHVKKGSRIIVGPRGRKVWTVERIFRRRTQSPIWVRLTDGQQHRVVRSTSIGRVVSDDYCIEGDCDHPADDAGGMDACPSTMFEVCVDCMDEEGRGRHEEGWDDCLLSPWPHPGSVGWSETPA